MAGVSTCCWKGQRLTRLIQLTQKAARLISSWGVPMSYRASWLMRPVMCGQEPGSMPVRRGAHGVEVTKVLPLRLHSNWMSCRPESAAIMVPENGMVH